MSRSALTGTRIRERRTLLGMKQSELARLVSISPSYLNLIEHNRRRIAGKILSEIARVLQVEVAALTQGAQAELLEQLAQAQADAPGVAAEGDRVDEFVGRFPGWAELVQAQHRRIRDMQEKVEGLSDRLNHDPRLSSAMHEVLSKVTAIRSAASILHDTDDIDEAWQKRFHRNLNADSLSLTESAQDLVEYLDSAEQDPDAGISPWEEVERYLEDRKFHIPELEADGVPRTPPEIPDGLSAGARGLLTTYLDRYAREARLLPMGPVMRLLEDNGDPVALAARSSLPVGVVLRRMAAMPGLPGRDPVGMVLCDASGAIKLRKTTDGFLSPRSGHGCPLWPVYEAFGAPGRPVSRLLTHGAAFGERVQAFAVADPSWPLGADGPALIESCMVVLPVPSEETLPLTEALPVGSACRVCNLSSCAARLEPSLISG